MFDYAIHFDVTIDGQEHCLRKEIKSPVQLRPGDVVMVSVAMTSVKVAEIMWHLHDGSLDSALVHLEPAVLEGPIARWQALFDFFTLKED
jgi:hypothetical protein